MTMKGKISTREQQKIEDALAMLEMCVNNLAKNEVLSLENIHKAIHYTYEVITGGRPTILVGEPNKGKSHLIDFMQLIALNEKPMIDWSNVEGDVKEGGDKE